MTVHRRNRLPLALAIASILSLLWLWQMTLPLLEEQTRALQNRREQLKERQQAASAEIYQPLIKRLQRPLSSSAAVIAALRKTSGALDLAEPSYTLTPPQPLDREGLATRRLGISLPKAEPAAALALWQELRQVLPCELRLTSFTSDGPQAHLELELIGSAS